MREVCADFEAELKQGNGEQDHVHLLVHYSPKVLALKGGVLAKIRGRSADPARRAPPTCGRSSC
uniref:transposase n=1 Tax=Streptomyces cellulosae TaxID=1968 RepID=UPI00387EB2F2